MEFVSTKNANTRILALISGDAGIGKTSLLRTLPTPCVQVDFDDGNMCISDLDIPVIRCTSLADADHAISILFYTKGWNTVPNIFIDGLTRLAELTLDEQMIIHKDGRAAYGAMADEMRRFLLTLKVFKHKNIFCTCQQSRIQDDKGHMYFGPSFPGNVLNQKAPYIFDMVLAMRTVMLDGAQQRVLQTQPDMEYTAKDRSGKLARHEPPDLTAVINKIQANTIITSQ